MRLRLGLLLLALALLPRGVHAQAPVLGAVSGVVRDSTSGQPLENASVVLRGRADSTRVLATTSDKDGRFAFARVPWGAYVVECSLIGHRSRRTAPFTLSEASPSATLGPILLKASAVMLREVEVSSEKSVLSNGLDRRVYNVDHDVMARSSTASDLLQNIPSVQVDIDGNVSLRGSADVRILVNGKKSPLMQASRADVLQQLPAASIERIEVITNPSARYTPEGTSGIINIVMKSGAGAGLNGDATGHLGESGRHNEQVSLSGHPGALETFARYAYRSDLRDRYGADDRLISGTGATARYDEAGTVANHPRVHLGSAGLTWHASPKDAFDLSATWFRRAPTRNGLSTIVTRDTLGAIVSDYSRVQTGDEVASQTGVESAYEHDFAKPEHHLRAEATFSSSPDRDAEHFADHWRAPVQPDAAHDVVFRAVEPEGHLNLDYSDPMSDAAKLEAGFALELHRQDLHSDADSLDVAQQVIVPDPSRTYRFRLDQEIWGVYSTYERAIGRLGLLGGLRLEHARIFSNLITGGAGFIDRYTDLYPSAHVSYKLNGKSDVQLSYSRRIRRPESDDLNPFPEFTDPYNMEAGNPRLRPESIHAIELGYRYQGAQFSFVPSVYYRYRTNGFTRVTQALTDTTFLRTPANLASDQSAGLEPVFTLTLGRALQANVNADVFYQQIDATNLGFAGRRNVVSWSGNSNVSVSPWPATTFQVSNIYRSTRLTPQGDARPSYLMNVGVRQGMLHDRLALTLTVTDLFRTQRQETELDVAGIHQHVKTKRDTQLLYAGLTWHYGRPDKKEREKPVEFEE